MSGASLGKFIIGNLFKTKVLKDLLIRKKKSKNLMESLILFPNKGNNFKVYKKSWEPGQYFLVTKVENTT